MLLLPTPPYTGFGKMGGGHAPGAEETPSGESCALNGSEGKGSTKPLLFSLGRQRLHGCEDTTIAAFKVFSNSEIHPTAGTPFLLSPALAC